MPEPLPILQYRDAIVRAIHDRGQLILTAPTGSGKSTQVPQFFLDDREIPGKIYILEPRRIAARALASRVSQEAGKALGNEIGYQVRFESRCTERTRVVFQTYGVFFQQLLRRPRLKDAGLVILDEFHERTLECDAVLAWMAHLFRSAKNFPRFAVMSATLQAEALAKALPDAVKIDAPGRLYPVTISHQAPEPREFPPAQARRAVQSLFHQKTRGGILVFMPGRSEIRRTVEALQDDCRRAGFTLHELHGSQELGEQHRVLAAPPDQDRVIVATNVAETSLTIPGVRAVVDSGLSRQAAYDPDRDLNTLHLGKISLQNAAQRAGRAGRTGPGLCLRLWPAGQEKSLAPALAPEVRRLELGQLALRARCLLDAAGLPPADPRWLLPWPEEPDGTLWDKAATLLRETGAVDETGTITDMGRALAELPLPPRLGAVLHAAAAAGVAAEAAAGLAYLESGERRGPGDSADLWEWCRDFLEHTVKADREVESAYRQLLEFYSGRRSRPSEAGDAAKKLARCFLAAYRDRLAVRNPEERTYTLADGRQALLKLPAKKEHPACLLALEVHETAGAGQARRVTVPVFYACETDWLEEWFGPRLQTRAVCAWDEGRRKVVNEEQVLLDALVISRRPLQGKRFDREAAADLLAEKLQSGEINLRDEGVEQLLSRIALVARHCPEYGARDLDDDDWKLIYHELCRGKSGAADLSPGQLAAHILQYFGEPLAGNLDRLAPERMVLPSGKRGKIAYPPNAPPELSARITDFVGWKGKFTVCQGRAAGVFDILAPNYRTMQKTADLEGFWKNTYPEIKNELKRRYPRHPWP